MKHNSGVNLMDDEYYKVLVLAVTAILIVSLTINILLAADPEALSSPPIRVTGYMTGDGDPAPGYYAAGTNSGVYAIAVPESSQT